MMATNNLPSILQIKHVQQILSFNKSHTYELVKAPDFPLLKINNRMLVQRDDFFKWIETKRVNPPEASA